MESADDYGESRITTQIFACLVLVFTFVIILKRYLNTQYIIIAYFPILLKLKVCVFVRCGGGGARLVDRHLCPTTPRPMAVDTSARGG